MTKVENEHYEMIPSQRSIDAWDIRILEGMFVETVISYGAVRFDGKKDQMTFSFDVISSPDPDLSVDNVDLQIEAGEILESVMAKGMEEGYVKMREKE